jgi:hypothetical protein
MGAYLLRGDTRMDTQRVEPVEADQAEVALVDEHIAFDRGPEPQQAGRSSQTQRAAHRSPPPGLLASVFFALFVASIVAHFVLTEGAPYPTPFRPLDELQAHYLRFPDAARFVATLQFGASIPLGLCAVVLVSRMLFHHVRVAGVYIALFGGLGASFFLGISALAGWMLSQPGVADDLGALRIAQLFMFATGGVGHTTTLGLLLAGISVPSLMFGLIPRWACWFGLIVALLAELSFLSLAFPQLSILLPLARFPAYLWLLVAAFTLPKHALR